MLIPIASNHGYTLIDMAVLKLDSRYYILSDGYYIKTGYATIFQTQTFRFIVGDDSRECKYVDIQALQILIAGFCKLRLDYR